MRSVADLLSLSGRRVLIAGGAGHIGRATATALIELGATVGIVDREEAVCRSVAEALCRIRQGSAIPVPCDLADFEKTRETVREGIGSLGGLDILVHCAAFTGTTTLSGWAVPWKEQTPEAFEAGLRVNLTSAFVLAQAAQSALVRSNNGAICLVSSIYGMVGPDMRLYEGTSMANPAGYDASKGGLIQLTRYLATTLAPNIRVNCVSPGGIFRGQPEPFVSRYVSKTPLGRMGTEEDMAAAVCYLVSDLSSYITGHNLVVDGGWTVW